MKSYNTQTVILFVLTLFAVTKAMSINTHKATPAEKKEMENFVKETNSKWLLKWS